jgi:hypothetical protein
LDSDPRPTWVKEAKTLPLASSSSLSATHAPHRLAPPLPVRPLPFSPISRPSLLILRRCRASCPSLLLLGVRRWPAWLIASSVPSLVFGVARSKQGSYDSTSTHEDEEKRSLIEESCNPSIPDYRVCSTHWVPVTRSGTGIGKNLYPRWVMGMGTGCILCSGEGNVLAIPDGDVPVAILTRTWNGPAYG